MPYIRRRRPFSRRRRFARPALRRKRYVPRTIKRYVRRTVRRMAPAKYVVELYNGVPISTTASINCITDSISQGDTAMTREGDQIALRSIRLRYNCSQRSACDSLTAWRIVIFKWKPDDNVDAPTSVNDILQETASVGLTARGSYVLPIDSRRKFTVLADYYRMLGPWSNGTAQSYFNIDLLIPAKKLGKIRYTSGADTGLGHIYILSYCTGSYDAGAGNNWGYMTGDAVVRFSDA